MARQEQRGGILRNALDERRTACCFVQPVQSPYWTERFRYLACDGRLQLVLALERASFEHRPGWVPEAIENVNIDVLEATVVAAGSDNKDLGYKIRSVRSIPWRLPLYLCRLRPDVVVVCNATQAILAWLVRWLVGFRLLLLVEDTPHSVRNGGRLRNRIKILAYSCADRWGVFSNDARRYLEDAGITGDVAYLPWSVDMRRFRPRQSLSQVTGCARLDTRSSVVFVGSLIERKGVKQLIDAWSSLPKAVRARAHLTICGDGPLRRWIETTCGVRGLAEVELAGHVEYGRIADVLRDADLFVFPTLEDLYGLALLEALASGCAVITTPFTGGRELIEDGLNGWIVDPTEGDTLGRALERALGPDIDLQRMGEAARESVRRLDNSEVMSQFADELHALGKART